MDVDVSGLVELNADLDRAARQVDRAVRGVAGRVADQAARDAQSLASATFAEHGTDPDLGPSAERIHARTARGSPPAAFVIAGWRGAHFQELGTAFHPPQPTITPSVERHRGRFEKESGDAAARLLGGRR